MKFFKQILSVFLATLMLALVFVPCKDNCDDAQHQTTQSVESTSQHHEEHNDICSPFCVCSCCSVTITIQNLSSFQIVSDFTTESFSSHYVSSVLGVHQSIWQPPKIS